MLKIAEAQGGPKQPTFKRWLKNTALIGAGYAAGHGAAMLAEKGVQKMMGRKWNKWQSPAKKRILRAGAGFATAATFLAAENMIRQRMKAQQEP
jgi:hypothetical protein